MQPDVRERPDILTRAPYDSIGYSAQRGATRQYSCNQRSCCASSVWLWLRRAEVYGPWSVVYGLLTPSTHGSPITRPEPFRLKAVL